MNRKPAVVLVVASLLLLAGVLGRWAGPAAAQNDATPPRATPSVDTAALYRQFVANLAANLGISDPAKVDDAVKTALRRMVDDQEKSGAITSHDAGELRTMVDSDPATALADIVSGAHIGMTEGGIAGTPAAAGTTVQVTLTEYAFTASMTTFNVGQSYTFVVTNKGKIPHEMVLEKRGEVDKPMTDASGTVESEAADINPGETKTLTWTFTEPGEYQMGCHVPGHYEAGMLLPFTVTA